MGGEGIYLLTNRNTSETNNQDLLNSFSKDQQSDNVQIVNSVNDIKFVSRNISYSMFAIVKGKTSEESDRLYAWGDNTYGQLGLGNIEKRSTPTLVTLQTEVPEVQRISFVVTGVDFTLVVFENCSIWATGSNNKGQFGNGETSNLLDTSFKRSNDFFAGKKITNISAGFYHVAVIVNYSELYGWGYNYSGQVGIGTNRNNISTPTQVTKTIDNMAFEGSLSSVQCGSEHTFLVVTNSGKNKLYVWGSGYLGKLGFGNVNDFVSPKLLENPLIDGFTEFYAGWVTSFVYNSSTKKLYCWGLNGSNQLGLNSTDNKQAPVEVSLTFSERINNIFPASNSTKILTESGKIYTTGSGSYGAKENGLGLDTTTFTEIKAVSLTSSILSCGNTTLIFEGNEIYAWGTNTYGTYGDGSSTTYSTPTLVDPFSTPSSLVQNTIQDNTKTALTVAEEIYSAGVFKEAAFNAYVEKKGFPVGTIFTMISAPIVNVPKGEIKCTVQASKSYSQPDGVKSITDAPFEITLTGFKTIDSNLAIKSGKPWATEIKYENIMTKLGAGDTTNLDNLKKIYDLDSFPTTSTFKIDKPNLSFDSGTRMGTYTADLTASEYYFGGNLLKDGTFKIVVDELSVSPDSIITTRSDIDTNAYNLTNIDNKLRPGNVLQDSVFKTLFTTVGFASDNTFSSVTGGVVGNEYHVTVKADKAYVDGLIVSKDFELKIAGLVERPNSNPVAKAGQPWLVLYKYDTIKDALGEDGATSRDKLMELYDFSSFPTGTIYTISNAGVTFDRTTRIGTYKADITADKHYLDGNIDTNKKTYTITMGGFSVQVDTDIAQKPDLDTKKYNLTNINNKLCPNGALDKGIFEEIFITTNLPTDAILTSAGGTVTDEIFNITITTSKAWVDGFIKSADKDFILAVTGLQMRPDSTVIAKTPSPDELNDFISKLKEGEVIDTDTLGKLIDLSEFPDGTNFTINTVTPNENDSTIEFTFTPDQVYKDGNPESNTKTFDANVKFEFPAEPTADNTGLIVGLSIGGILLSLIIIGLVIWYLKHRNKDEEAVDNQSVLY